VETVIHIPAKDGPDPERPAADELHTSSRPVKRTLELRIIDPKEFRKVRHLVILTS
jgi:hypothetical protein